MLIAGGAFTILVGGIFAGVGLQRIAAAQDHADIGFDMAIFGAVLLGGGIAALAAGILIYRRCDHRMPRQVGDVSRFPLLSPIMVLLVLLVNGMLAWMVAEHGFGWIWDHPRGPKLIWGWGLLMILFVGAVIAAFMTRKKPAPSAPAPESSTEEERADQTPRLDLPLAEGPTDQLQPRQ